MDSIEYIQLKLGEFSLIKKDKTHLMEVGKFTSFTFIGEIARYLFLIIASALVTNFFGAKVFGQYSYIISFITILITFSGLGVGSGVMYFGQKYKQQGHENKTRGIITYAYILVAVSGSILTTIIIIFAEPISKILLNSPEYAPLLARMAPLILIESLYGLSLTVFRSLKRIARYSLVRNIFYHFIRIAAILVCFAIFGIKDINGIIIPTYIAYTSVLAYNLFNQYRNSDIGKLSEISVSEKKEMIKYSLPLFMSAIIGILLRQADILMLGYIKTEEAVAVYKISIQICAIIPFFKHVTGSFFSPMIASLYHSGKKGEMVNTYKEITKWSFTVGLMIFLGIVLFGKSGLHLFGEEFVYAHTALILVACGHLVGVIVGHTGSVISMTGHPKFNLVTSGTIFTINIILNLIMIPKYGIIGAAVATLVSRSLGNIMVLAYLYITQKIHPYDIRYLKPIAAGTLSYITIYVLNKIIMWDGVTDILIKGFIFVIIYVGTIIILKIDEDDKVILNSMFSAVKNLFIKNKR